jgi:hypothetical protein
MLEYDDGTCVASPYTIAVDVADRRDYTTILIFVRPSWVGDDESGWRLVTKFVGGPDEGGWVYPDDLQTYRDTLDLQHHNMVYGRPAYPSFRAYPVYRERGKGYPAHEAAVKEWYGKLAHHHPELLVDITGVGGGVVQYMRQAGLPAVGVYFHQGNEVRYIPENDQYNVPVKELVGAAQILMEQQRIDVGPSEHTEDLKRELLAFTRKIKKETAHESFGAWRENIHDDLVFGLSMGAWWQKVKMEPWEQHLQDEYLARFGGGSGWDR